MDEQEFKKYCHDFVVAQKITFLNAITKDLYRALAEKQMEENIRIVNEEN